MNVAGMVALIDLDGSICNDEHRVHLAEAEQYLEYHRACAQDTEYPVECELVRAWSERGGIVIYVTGRYESCRSSTERWLQRAGLPSAGLTMRRDDDLRPAAELKAEVLNAALSIGMRVAWALDDCDSVVEMYRERGITCLQPRRRSY